MENTKSTIRTRLIDIVQISLMAAIIFIATKIISIPSHMGVIHLGDSMIFVAAIMFGKKKAAIASAIGMSMFDILSPYIMWAPFTFVIKGVMGYIAGHIAYRKNYNGSNIKNNIAAFIIAGLWMIAAYYLGGILINKFFYGMPFKAGILISLKDIPGNILQVAAGIVIALPLTKGLKAIKSH